MSESCATCRFWLMDKSTLANDETDFTFGWCRRKPPTVVGHIAAMRIDPPRYGDQTDLDLPITALWDATRFPATFATDWCGEHRPTRESDPEMPIC